MKIEIDVVPDDIDITLAPAPLLEVNLALDALLDINLVPESIIDINIAPASAIDISLIPASILSIEMTQGGILYLNYTLVASEVISGHHAVLANGYYATNDGTLLQALCVGISNNAADMGEDLDVRPDGMIMDMIGWSWTVGELIYLSTDGALTQSIPPAGSYHVVLGVALSPTSMLINIQNPVLL